VNKYKILFKPHTSEARAKWTANVQERGDQVMYVRSERELGFELFWKLMKLCLFLLLERVQVVLHLFQKYPPPTDSAQLSSSDSTIQF